MRETFGGEINCAGVADGWRAYNIFPVLQRCWAHLIREVDAFIEKPGGKELSEIIHVKFRALKEFLGKDPPPSMEERKQQKEVWDREMAELAEQSSKFNELKKPVTYIRNGLGDWYLYSWTINPNVKYYQIPGKSQFPNPKKKGLAKIRYKTGSIGIWDLFGSVGLCPTTPQAL